MLGDDFSGFAKQHNLMIFHARLQLVFPAILG